MRRWWRRKAKPTTPEPDLIIWDDISPGDDRCDWTGCNERARWVMPSVIVTAGVSEYIPDTQWCDEHYEQVIKVGVD